MLCTPVAAQQEVIMKELCLPYARYYAGGWVLVEESGKEGDPPPTRWFSKHHICKRKAFI